LFSTLDLSRNEPYLIQITDNLSKAHISAQTISLDGAICQFAITLKRETGIRASDDMFRAKQYIKEITQQWCGDWCAGFMTKPDAEGGSNSQRFTHSLWIVDTLDGVSSRKQNAFHDLGSDTTGLSKVADHWIAGLMHHAAGLTALCCPTVNCYRRLDDQWAPRDASWGCEDWSAWFCVKYLTRSDLYVENCLPGGSANPYLVLAATVAAGMAGIRNKYPLPLPENRVQLPRSLAEALIALEEDEVFVEALGKKFVESFIRCKREYELNVLVNNSIEEECELYYKML